MARGVFQESNLISFCYIAGSLYERSAKQHFGYYLNMAAWQRKVLRNRRISEGIEESLHHGNFSFLKNKPKFEINAGATFPGGFCDEMNISDTRELTFWDVDNEPLFRRLNKHGMARKCAILDRSPRLSPSRLFCRNENVFFSASKLY